MLYDIYYDYSAITINVLCAGIAAYELCNMQGGICLIKAGASYHTGFNARYILYSELAELV